MSRYRSSLCIDQLKEIQGRNDSADVIALLWEVRRLREIAATADELERSLGPRIGMSGLIRASLRVQLDGEPCFAIMQPPE